ncbi:MAG: FxsA family protein [Arcobacteraceae bacterium]|nr:FxsA family protein [Arcobacteraceae bacterium]
MIYVIIYIFLEVMISTTIAGNLGGFLTFMEIIATAFIGTFILKNFKYSLASNIKDLTQGQISQQDFIKRNVGNAVGAMFLILPGFFTDILGVLLQFGLLTVLLGKMFSFKPPMQTNGFDVNPNQNSTNNQFYTQVQFEKEEKGKKDEDIIDVEVIEPNKPSNS